MAIPKRYLILAILVISSFSCRNSQTNQYHEEISSWRESRLERLKSKTGWLNLAGLYWLNEGDNTFGSDSSNLIVFPSNALPFYGRIQKTGDSLMFIAAQGSEVTVDGELVVQASLLSDASGKPSLMECGNMAWFIIKRDEQYAIRLRDYGHPRIDHLDSIPCYETSEEWKIVADYIPFDSILKIEIATVTGGTEVSNCPGKLVFRKGLRSYTLYPFSEGKDFFIIVADKTNGIETYGNGRYMYASLPDSTNKVILDFNMAYNPPCAFSPFATCPMPPHENILNLRIEAGEKEVHLQ